MAIKLVRTGYDTTFILQRFRNERQILAGLDHPNIARLLDGGTTDEGIPYLVMELVDGVRIDDHCDAHKLTITERLQLFRQVCSAVQYAHQHLVIHRDIKPSNILVTEAGTPKLLDFGIAKLLDESGNAEATVLRPMTPEYASPEQIRGRPSPRPRTSTLSASYSINCLPATLPTALIHVLPQNSRKQLPAANLSGPAYLCNIRKVFYTTESYANLLRKT